MDKLHTALGSLFEHWDDLVADAEATAAEYREAGYRTVELHPGDVTAVVDDERFELNVLVPGDEFDRVESAVADHEFAASDVYRREADDVVFLLVVYEAADADLAVLCPAYYNVTSGTELRDRAEREGAMYTTVRPLDDDREVTFEHDAYAPFFED